jgi:uncharacterized protein YdeI (YjbR/CyaY-like superfamily)
LSRTVDPGQGSAIIAPDKSADLTDRKEWRRWLRNNRQTAKEAWMVFSRKSSGRPRIPNNDAVEEALCFGWINSNVRRLDESRFA